MVILSHWFLLHVASQGVRSVTVPTPLCVSSTALCTPSPTGQWCPRPGPACLWSSTLIASWAGCSPRDASRSAPSLVLWRDPWFPRVNCRNTTFISKWVTALYDSMLFGWYWAAFSCAVYILLWSCTVRVQTDCLLLPLVLRKSSVLPEIFYLCLVC